MNNKRLCVTLYKGDSSSSYWEEDYVEWAPYTQHLFAKEINNAMYMWLLIGKAKGLPKTITLLVARFCYQIFPE